jgi:hypothetical protein
MSPAFEFIVNRHSAPTEAREVAFAHFQARTYESIGMESKVCAIAVGTSNVELSPTIYLPSAAIAQQKRTTQRHGTNAMMSKENDIATATTTNNNYYSNGRWSLKRRILNYPLPNTA